MAKVILICGRLCTGKTTYARQLAQNGGMVLLSIDEIMLSMFGQYCGDMHETYAARAERYLISKAVEIVSAGMDVILDWGFWRREQRSRIRDYYENQGIPCEMHFVEADDATWRERIRTRNAEVEAGKTQDYYVDDNLIRKFEGMFEAPEDSEIDAYYPEN